MRAPRVALYTSKRYFPVEHSVAPGAQLPQQPYACDPSSRHEAVVEHTQCPSRSPRGQSRGAADRVTAQTEWWGRFYQSIGRPGKCAIRVVTE